MIYANGLKYACEACIKGHRSSSCSHRQRPLFEIKKKGRPVSQCEHCRQLRKTKQVHVKCNCEGGTEDVGTVVRGKAKRKMPASAAFPEGLRETDLSPSPPVPQKKSQASVSNNCACKSSGLCSCATLVIKKSDRFQVSGPSSDAYSPTVAPPPLTSVSSCCSGKNKPTQESHPQVRSNVDFNPHPPSLNHDFALAAPQVVTPASYSTNDVYHGSVPTLATDLFWPSGPGIGVCSCGASCACPGCFEHSDPSTILNSSENCPYACTTCSNCDGFGFAPSLSHQPAGTFTSSLPPPFITWPHSPAVTSFASSSRSHTPTPTSTSDCCGGSCKCSRQSLSCQCSSECCGCCSGCSCSESESEAAGAGAGQEGDTRERLGFAVSGERGSCCSETERYGHERQKDNEEGDSRTRKRRRVEARASISA
ncbi:hypothetical protein JB92DRAFT_2989408 [Gautieria morchelliformis]|nr:hypothetical protein JB92DRAFT_2989408 [Gautieria morchelliformis]